MDKGLFETLLNKTESEELDFKSEQYKLDTEEQKAEFIKDVLAFANAWKTSDAYIICGVLEKDGRAENIEKVDHHLEDNNLQQLVCSKTNKPPRFTYEPFTYEEKELGIIIIYKDQDRPIYLRKNFGWLKANEVYIRRGSSTGIASPDEIKKMGEYSLAVEIPVLNIQLKNKENGTIIEKDAFLKSTILYFEDLIDKPESSTEKTKTTDGGNQASSFSLIDKALTEKIKVSTEALSKSLEAIKYDPDYPEKLKHYLQLKKIFTPISFIVQNIGASTAYDVKTEVRIKKLEYLEIFLSYHFLKPPSKNRFYFSELTLPIFNKDIEKSIIFEETEDEYLFGIKFGKIQPKDTLESKGFLYIGAFTPLEFEMHTKTFADNLPNPIEKTFNFRIEVNEEKFYLNEGEHKP